MKAANAVKVGTATIVTVGAKILGGIGAVASVAETIIAWSKDDPNKTAAVNA